MNEIIAWLISIERMANQMYQMAADTFHDDKPLAKFLRHAAEDEAWHYHTMQSAAEYIRHHVTMPAEIMVCNATREKIETPFQQGLQLLDKGALTKEHLIDIIVASEFSEWNEIFLYIVNSLSASERMFEHVASRMQQHLQFIKNSLAATEHGREKLQAFMDIPQVWEEKILIVDDDEAIRQLLSSLLGRQWRTQSAANGSEALQMLRSNYFDLILSDVDMPGMNGIEFFQEASSFIHNLGSFFILHTGGLNAEREKFCEENGIQCIPKPSSISYIMETVASKLLALREKQ